MTKYTKSYIYFVVETVLIYSFEFYYDFDNNLIINKS